MLQQPRVPPTGQRQAIEIQIKWREVLANQQALMLREVNHRIAKTTGHTTEKLAKVTQLSPAPAEQRRQIQACPAACRASPVHSVDAQRD